ncbi:unnamed protein product [Lactuca saligna]|uniref:Uncharacterized protein n=1 Tax=Lactuca saligna TaxID=75948 RepID=A0AA35Y3D6_LACSI|nr:unnamed protein product [Lactuca saligna]
MFEDKVSLLRYALQRAFQAAPNRLMTKNTYLALLGASLNASTIDEGLNLYDSQHRFEHSQLLLVLLSSLPHAPKTFQCRVLQDLLILACSHVVFHLYPCPWGASIESIHDSLAEALVNLTEECEKLWSKVYVVWPKSRTRSIKTKAL